MYQVVEGRLSFLHIAREFAKSDLKIGQEKMHQKHFKTSTDLFSTQSTKKSTFSGSMSLDFSPTFNFCVSISEPWRCQFLWLCLWK